MKTTTIPPPPVRFDVVYRFTIEDYYRLAEVGILAEDERVELLDGQIIPMSPVGPEHHWILRELLQAFMRQEDGRFETAPVRSLPIPRHNEPEPDLMLYRPGTASRHQHVSLSGVLLVIEISDSTLGKDLGFKANLYQEAKIPEYWVIDIPERCLRVFRLVN